MIFVDLHPYQYSRSKPMSTSLMAGALSQDTYKYKFVVLVIIWSGAQMNRNYVIRRNKIFIKLNLN